MKNISVPFNDLNAQYLSLKDEIDNAISSVIKSSSFVISLFGFFVGIFWLTYLSQIGILSIIDTLGAFFGPLFGIIISDFYFIKKGNLNNKDIYSLEKTGEYYYSGGWHIKGVYSLVLGFILKVRI